MQDGDIVNGIWVTGTYWGSDASDNSVDIPASGIRIEEVAQPMGGWDVVRATCRDCEANVAGNSPNGIAGCHESLDVMYPHSEELDALLWETIRLRGLEERLRACFRVTKPLWFGFWIDSPLRRTQCELLLDLLPYALPRLWGKDEAKNDVEPVFDPNQFVCPDFDPSEYYGKEFSAFFAALRTAINWELPLHVHMAPPGHTDFGFYTQFAHCPRCKAAARVPRWTESVESCSIECEVCGNTFDPAPTYSSEPFEFNSDADSLEKQLGDNYDAFAIRFGQSKGVTVQQMTEALDNHRDGPRRRKVAECRKRVDELEQKYAEDLATLDAAALPSSLILEVARGVTLEMKRIMPGEFMMGSNENEQEQPIHLVQMLEPFYIGMFPITQIQWEAVMGSNPSRCRHCSNLPVEQVTWFDAQEFCSKLSEIVGRQMRLPSEAEWEYACRAGTSTKYWFGDEISSKEANFDASIRSPEDFFRLTERDESKRTTTPVDQFRPNPWGIYDMHGNVEEWCQDSWHGTYLGAPRDGRAWIDQSEPVEHVARGGAAYTIAGACRSAARRQQRANCGARPYMPEDEESESESLLGSLLRTTEYYGVRIVCSPKGSDLGWTHSTTG